MPIERDHHNGHRCLMFHDLCDDGGSAAVQANQFLIVDEGAGATIDPGDMSGAGSLRRSRGHWLSVYVFARNMRHRCGAASFP